MGIDKNLLEIGLSAFNTASKQGLTNTEAITNTVEMTQRKQESERNKLMEAMDFEPIQKALGDNSPALVPGEVGRVRLMEALRMTFGEGFRSNQMARGLIEHFDKQTSTAKDIMSLREQVNGQ